MTDLLTERLELRRWRADDVDPYAAIVADPEVMRYMRGEPGDRAAAWREIALFMGHRELRGWSQAAVVERASGPLIGRGGLWQPEGWPGLEVGWVLERSARAGATRASSAAPSATTRSRSCARST